MTLTLVSVGGALALVVLGVVFSSKIKAFFTKQETSVVKAVATDAAKLAAK